MVVKKTIRRLSLCSREKTNSELTVKYNILKKRDANTPPVTGSGILYSLRNFTRLLSDFPRNKTRIAITSVCLASSSKIKEFYIKFRVE